MNAPHADAIRAVLADTAADLLGRAAALAATRDLHAAAALTGQAKTLLDACEVVLLHVPSEEEGQ